MGSNMNGNTSVDGSFKQKLNNDYTCYIDAVDEWIYYQNRCDVFRFYRVKTDGSIREKIPDA